MWVTQVEIVVIPSRLLCLLTEADSKPLKYQLRYLHYAPVWWPPLRSP